MASSLSIGWGWNPVQPMQKQHGIQMGGSESAQLPGSLAVHLIGTGEMKKTETKWRQTRVPSMRLASLKSPGLERLDGTKTTRFPTPEGLSHITMTASSLTSRSLKSMQTLSCLQNRFKVESSSLDDVHSDGQYGQTNAKIASMSALLMAISTFVSYGGPASASDERAFLPTYGDLGSSLEAGVQLLYLGALLVLLGVGSFLVVRQILIKRELETAAKDLQDRVRGGEASSLEYFELGAVMLRKKFYQLARKYLNEAIKRWDGSEQDLAQVYNALGFSYFSDGNVDKAVSQYEKAVKLQPTYVTAWNNLADAYESKKEYSKALKAYEEALQFDPNNRIASARRGPLKERLERLQGIP